MKQPTEDQRRVIYKEALKRIKDGSEEFMCNAIIHVTEEITKKKLDHLQSCDIIKHFPEFIKQKPKESFESILWYFNGSDSEKKAKRIKVLENAIRITKF